MPDRILLRDWFAGQALQGFIQGGAVGHITDDMVAGGLGQSNAEAERFIAQASYAFADAMLKARGKDGATLPA